MTTSAKQLTFAEFEGDEVSKSSVRLVGLGDGLGDAWGLNAELHRGEEVYFLVKGRVKRVLFDEKDEDSDEVVRVHVIKGTAITQVDGDVAVQMIAAAADRNERRKAEIKGQLMLEAEKAAEEREAADAVEDANIDEAKAAGLKAVK